MQIKEYHFPSATGVCEIYGNTYTADDGQYNAVLVIHHGMAEHQERYIDFINYLTSNGFCVYMNDMANHGRSNQDYSLTGYFGEKDGYKALVEDLNTTFKKAKEENPDKKIFVMGHSMGSFITRCFTAWHNDAGFAAAIYMGTGGTNPMAALGDRVSGLVAKIKGCSSKSKLLDSMAFGSYNKQFEGRTNYDWLTRDTNIVDKYIADRYCGFLFSAQGMNDLIKLNIAANTDEWYKAVPDVPILLISGDKDPVGDYSKGILEVGDKLKKSGHTKVDVKLFKNARHEVLNEINRQDVYEYVKNFLQSYI